MVAAPPEMRLIYLLRRLERAVRTHLDTTVRRFDLTTPQYTALSVLRVRAGLTSAQLARRAFVSAQAMNEIVIQLEEAGLIVRVPSPEHRKSLICGLTEDGREVFDACDEACGEVEATMITGLNDGDVAVFRSLLRQGISGLAD